MKKAFLLFLLFLLPLLMPAVANAYDAEIDGILYNFSYGEAELTSLERKGNSNSYSGALKIPNIENDSINSFVDEPAHFPGSDDEMNKWLRERIIYPANCLRQKVQGRVIVSFVVGEYGFIEEVKAIRSPHPSLSDEAERVVKLMPKWIPAKVDGKEERTRYFLPIKFNLSQSEPIDTLYTITVDQVPTVPSAPSAPSLTITANGVSFNMICVEGGTFWMGATSDLLEKKYHPPHHVTLPSYHIGETEVTQALWEAVMGSNPSKFKGANRPVERVSWDDCQTFISKLNAITGKTFRLPTEAEWEYAARGGNKSMRYKYSGSNTMDEVGWYYENSGNSRLDDTNWDYDELESNGGCTHPVKQKKANELGIYDMSGNVWEWCQYWDVDYSSSSQTNPTGPSSLRIFRAYRGGGWGTEAWGCPVSGRSRLQPYGWGWGGIGLRLAL